MNRKISKLLQPSVQLYFVILILFALASALFSIPLAVLEAVVVLILGLYTRTSGHKRRREITKYIENITGNVDVATKDTMVNSPLPMVIFPSGERRYHLDQRPLPAPHRRPGAPLRRQALLRRPRL